MLFLEFLEAWLLFVGQFGAAPENIAAMSERVLREVRRMQTEGPPVDQVENAKAGAKRELELAARNASGTLKAEIEQLLRTL